MVYKVDRLTRSLADFAKMVEVFDSHGVSFVAVTQQFIYGPLARAPRPAKSLNSDAPVAFIYPASDGLLDIAQGPDGNPRTLSSINTAASLGLNCCQVWKVPVRPVRHQLLTMACAILGLVVAVFWTCPDSVDGLGLAFG